MLPGEVLRCRHSESRSSRFTAGQWSRLKMSTPSTVRQRSTTPNGISAISRSSREGEKPSPAVWARFVHIQATGNAYIRPGGAGTTCTVNDLLLSPNMFVRLNVQGFTHIAYIQETAAAKINITPLEAG